VTVRACPAEWLIIADVQVDTIFVQVTDDRNMTALTRATEWLIVARGQACAVLMEPTNGIQIATLGRRANSLIKGCVLSAPPGLKNRNATQQSTPVRD
jgi:hypothetical protein